MIKNNNKQKKYCNKDILEDLYCNKNYSEQKIAKKLNCARNTVRKYINKYKLKSKITCEKIKKSILEFGDEKFTYKDIYNIINHKSETKLKEDEAYILPYICYGYLDKEISEKTGISLGCIKYRVANILKKFKKNNRQELIYMLLSKLAESLKKANQKSKKAIIKK